MTGDRWQVASGRRCTELVEARQANYELFSRTDPMLASSGESRASFQASSCFTTTSNQFGKSASQQQGPKSGTATKLKHHL